MVMIFHCVGTDASCWKHDATLTGIDCFQTKEIRVALYYKCRYDGIDFQVSDNIATIIDRHRCGEMAITINSEF